MVDEVEQITVRELARNTAQVLERVGAGESIEITRNGEPVAVLSPPDIEDITIRGLIKAGYVSPNWQQEKAELLDELRAHRAKTAPGKRPLSQVLIEMR